jgi:hypothetical protein
MQITQITTFQLDFQHKKLDLNSLQIHKIVALFQSFEAQHKKRKTAYIQYSCVFGFDLAIHFLVLSLRLFIRPNRSTLRGYDYTILT